MHEQVHGNNAAPAVNGNSLDSLLSQIDPDELVAAAKGLFALLATFNALRDDTSAMVVILNRIGLLTKAAYIPDTGTFNVQALQFLMGCSDDTVRRTAELTDLLKKESPRRGSTMYRSNRDEGNADE